MFAIDAAAAEAVRRVLAESGELAAAVELRRRFPGLRDIAQARSCVRSIATWAPPAPPAGAAPSTPGFPD